jgi:hypothetical protein
MIVLGWLVFAVPAMWAVTFVAGRLLGARRGWAALSSGRLAHPEDVVRIARQTRPDSRQLDRYVADRHSPEAERARAEVARLRTV